jgi:aspartate kinase|uniref:Aspartokinase n=1 Tax=candidate division WOR-3 bacterium TaxID=2052148 RepID=A0A7V3RIN2_UNCW3
MGLTVVKFGGTSVANADLIMRAAQRVARIKKNNDVIVVVSAMGHTTDELIKLANEITNSPRAREMDMLLTAGERISVALFTMALQRLNLKAISFTGSQVGIITDNRHTDARIMEIKGERLKNALDQGYIPVVCGFQGVSFEKEITTLGRGGSDTTAVALASAFGAHRCIIFTDVDGVFTEDPNRFPGVKKINKISYEEMLELASRGAKVLHPRATGIGARFGIPIEIKNSFNNKPGTIITHISGIEHPKPKAITHSEDLYLITLVQVPKNPGYLSQITTEMTNAGVHLKFFFHGISDAPRFDLSFITPLNERNLVRDVIKRLLKRLKIKEIRESLDISSISIIGAGIGSEHRILAEIFKELSRIKVHIEAVTTSELSVNLFLKNKFLDKAIEALLKKFQLKE